MGLVPEFLQYHFDRFRYSLDMIPPLQGQNQSALATGIGNIHQDARQISKAPGCNLHLAQGILVIDIKTGRNQDQFRFEGQRHRHQQPSINLDILRIIHAGPQGDIDRITLPRSPADFLDGARSGIGRGLVR